MMRSLKNTFVLLGFMFLSKLVLGQVSWTVNSADFSLDAAVIGSLTIQGELSTDENDVVAVFDDTGVIRGVSKVTYSNSLKKHLIFLTILSNTNGDKLNFKIYDASEDVIYEATNDPIIFEPNKVYGTNEIPIELFYEKELSVSKNSSLSFSVFPNPIISNINVSSNHNIDEVKIFSILGKQVYQGKFNENKCTINIENFSAGIYLVKVFSGSNISSKKVIKR